MVHRVLYSILYSAVKVLTLFTSQRTRVLLTNLLNKEKECSGSLATTTDLFQASINALQAYAAASAPPTSHLIVAVSNCIANADEAIRKYCVALESWRLKLQALKDLEDEVGNVMRDRELL